MIHQHGFTQQGWECPKCGKVYSPTTIMCLTCGQEVKTNITTNTPWNTVTVTNDIINGTTTDTTTKYSTPIDTTKYSGYTGTTI